MKVKTQLEGDDIFLKSFDSTESELYRNLRNAQHNRKFFLTQKEISAQMQQVWFENYLHNEQDYMFAVYEKKSGFFVGAIALYHIDNENKSAEVGRLLIDSTKVGGKGYAAQAINSLLYWGERQLGIEKFYAQILVNNWKSFKSFQKNNFILLDTRNEDNQLVWYMEKEKL